MFTDEERIFVGAMRRAAILQHAQAARCDLFLHALLERDHAVRDVFLEPVPRQRLTFTALAGDDRRNAAILQPAKEAA